MKKLLFVFVIALGFYSCNRIPFFSECFECPCNNCPGNQPVDTTSNNDTTPSLDPDLISYFPFDTDANDYSGNDNHPIGNTATFIEGAGIDSTACYVFDGSSNYIQCDTMNYGIKDELTVSVWVKSLTYSTVFVVNKYDYDADAGWHIMLHQGAARINGRDKNVDYVYCRSDKLINDGNWHHIVGVVNHNVWQLWVDGSLSAETNTGNYSTTIANKEHLEIGFRDATNDTPYPSGFFEGSIDEIKIYKRALTPSEIAVLYNE